MASEITKWASKDGEFRRLASQFRNQISRIPGSKFSPEKDRYHLYISHACPWANRTSIVRNLKGLQKIIPMSVVSWHLTSDGWHFDPNVPGATDEPLYGKRFVRELYFKANENYEGRFTVPVLWDKKLETIVSNESAEIIRMFYHEFDDLLEEKFQKVDLLPKDLAEKIDEINTWIYDTINNGVYKCGFATTQESYDNHVFTLFKSLDRVETILGSTGPYLMGDHLTEADVRLFTTMIRFDPVYVQHFKCNIGMIRHDYPHIHKWLRYLYWNHEEFKQTVNFEHIKKHYTKSHTQINPFSITPAGPVPDILQ